MSRGISPKSASHELCNSCCSCREIICNNCNHDMISNLKVQVFAKDQNKKNFQNLLSMYHKLEEELLKITEQKKAHEIALCQLESDCRNNSIIELKNKNENLFNELNEKIALNKKLYNENNQLFQELEARTAQSEHLEDQINEQEELIRTLKCDNEEIKKKVICLSQVKEKQESDIHELTIQINKFNLHSNDQVNILNNKNGQNFEIINILHEEKNINKNLQIELKSKENTIISNQQELNRNNDNIHLIQNNINNVENTIKKNSEDISIVNNNILKETSLINKLCIDNQQLNNLVKDRDMHINQLNNDNNILKQDNNVINCQNEKVCKLLEAYKKHLCLLISQNKKLSCEIQFLLSRDSELKTILERDNHLKDVQYENDQFMNNSIEQIGKCVEGGGITTTVEKKTTIKRTYSIDGNNGINLMDSPSLNKSASFIEKMNNENEINPCMSGNIQDNKLNLSQNYFHMNENEKEEM